MREQRSVREYLLSEGLALVVIYAVVLTVVAALAVSRATDSLLSPGTVAAVVAVVGAVAGLLGRLFGLYEGAHALLERRVRAEPVPAAGGDPLAPSRLGRSALGWGLALGAWSGAAGLLVAAVLQGKRAPFVVAAVVFGLVGGAASVIAGVVGRSEGVAAAVALAGSDGGAAPLRRRAWRHVALPMAVAQGLVNAAFAVLLFHDYATGDPLASRPLTESIARADALIVVTLLTALFGTLATRWGRVDAALGRVVADDDALAGISAKHPLGAQAFVYVAFGGLLAFTAAGWLLPPLPSLLRVVIVRGAIAAVLTFVVCGVAHTRGALNVLSGAVPLAPPARRVRPARRRLPAPATAARAALLVVMAVVALRSAAAVPRATADAPQAQLVAEGDAFVARVEYDVPIPAGTGTVARVAGRVGPPSGENAYGLAAAPTNFDAVVSTVWANPVSDEDPLKPGDQSKGPIPIPDENRLPQVECFYPGQAVDLRFSFPTDARDDLRAVPPVGYATAQCTRAPEAEVHARMAEFGGTKGGGALVATGPGGADGVFRPVRGVLEGTSNAWAHDVRLLGGAIRVGAVRVEGASAVTGRPGGEHTVARVQLQDVAVGGVRFSLDGGRLVVGGQARPLDSAPGRQTLEAANAALAATGCRLTVLGPTDRYPQGFVLSRKEPDLGTRRDGSLAASMAGGMLIVCDLPESLTKPSGYNPQRLQILLGFVYTSASASQKPGGFGIGDLVGRARPPLSAAPQTVAGAADRPAPATGAAPSVGATLPATEGGAPPVARAVRPAVGGAALRAVAGVFGKWPLWVAALGVWLALTERGLRRVRAILGFHVQATEARDATLAEVSLAPFGFHVS